MSDDPRHSELDPLATTTDATNGFGPHDDDAADDAENAATGPGVESEAPIAAAVEDTAPAAEAARAGDAVAAVEADAGFPDLLTRLADAMRQTVESERSRVGEEIDRRRTEHLAAIAGRRESEATRMRELAASDRRAIESWADEERQRIQKERDERLAAVEADLATSLDEHAKTVDAQIERVESAISAHRAEVDDFFGSLGSETDPVRIAQVAGRRPAFPDLETVTAASAPAPAPEVVAHSTADESFNEPVEAVDQSNDAHETSDTSIGASATDADMGTDHDPVDEAAPAGATALDRPTGMPVMDPIARLGLLRAGDLAAEPASPRPVPAGAWRPPTVDPDRERPATPTGTQSGGHNPIAWIRRKDESADR